MPTAGKPYVRFATFLRIAAWCGVGWGGVGWGGMLMFLVLRALYIATLLRSLGSCATLHVATLLRSLGSFTTLHFATLLRSLGSFTTLHVATLLRSLGSFTTLHVASWQAGCTESAHREDRLSVEFG